MQRRTAHNRRVGLIVGFILFVLIGMHYIGWLGTIEELIRTLSFPVFRSVYNTGAFIRDKASFWRGRSELVSALQTCRQNASITQLQVADVKKLKDENDDLRKQLHLLLHSQTPMIIAEVVGKDITNEQQLLLLNKGERAGIKVGYPVVVDEGVLVGKVIKVTPDASWILLINDNQSKVAATILNKDKSLGVVEGGYGISLQMKLIPRNETVAVGDQVMTSGLEKNIPRGLLIGSVSVVENEAYQPFQQALIDPPHDLSKIFIVGVLQTN